MRICNDDKKGISLFLIFSFFNALHPHGFGANTVVQNEAGGYWPIANIVDYVGEGHGLQVLSYDEFQESFIPKRVKLVGFCESEYCCRLSFKHSIISLECTPLQLFYRIKDHAWVAAFKLQAGDKLLCADNKTIEVANIELVHEKLKVYTLEIKGTHTFLVTRHNIVAHNMLLPCGAIAGLAIPLDIGCGASIGSVFGPVGICTGVIVGGVVGCILNTCIKDRVIKYGLSFKSREISQFKKANNVCNFAKTVEEVLKDTMPGEKTSKEVDAYIKSGSYPEAVKDFENLQPTGIRDIPTGKRGVLPDGRDINVRTKSTEGSPTLEIYDRNTKRSIKIRYKN